MEDMALNIATRSGDIAIRISRQGITNIKQAVALIKALVYKVMMTGQISVKNFLKNFNARVYEIPAVQVAAFKEECKKNKMIYAIGDYKNQKKAEIYIKHDDEYIFNKIIGNIGIVKNDIEVKDLKRSRDNNKFSGNQDWRQEFKIYTIHKEDSRLFKDIANKNNLLFSESTDASTMYSFCINSAQSKIAEDILSEIGVKAESISDENVSTSFKFRSSVKKKITNVKSKNIFSNKIMPVLTKER